MDKLANTLAQNCGKPMMEELASRNWTQALDRLVNDRVSLTYLVRDDAEI